jgi:RNA polymerase sigma-70 factor (ECF subfamily)
MNPQRPTVHHATVPPTDSDLIARCRVGDAAAFCTLVERHHRAVYRTALAIVRSREDAEDVAQESWLQASQHAGDFQGQAAVRTWLLAITRNQAISHRRATCRRQMRDAAALQHASEWHEQWLSDHSPERVMLHRQRARLLDREMEALPDTLKTPLQLWHSEIYSYGDIARMLSISSATVKTRIWTARQRLKAPFQHTVNGRLSAQTNATIAPHRPKVCA